MTLCRQCGKEKPAPIALKDQVEDISNTNYFNFNGFICMDCINEILKELTDVTEQKSLSHQEPSH